MKILWENKKLTHHEQFPSFPKMFSKFFSCRGIDSSLNQRKIESDSENNLYCRFCMGQFFVNFLMKCYYHVLDNNDLRKSKYAVMNTNLFCNHMGYLIVLTAIKLMLFLSLSKQMRCFSFFL